MSRRKGRGVAMSGFVLVSLLCVRKFSNATVYPKLCR
jgi:hypothetical protein